MSSTSSPGRWPSGLTTFLAATLLLPSSGPGFAADAVAKSGRPNLVLIMADDLGFSDLGCYGGEIETPNLDRLAAGGLRFTRFYNAGRCCPTRASLLTGLYAHQTGIGLMEDDVGVPAYQGFLNRRCVTIGEALRRGGYRTLISGKWNVGYRRPQWPTDRGFDRAFGLLRGASNYFDPHVGPRSKISLFALDGEVFNTFDDQFYCTDAFTDYALKWLDEGDRSRPFFLYVPYTAPHSPLHAWPEDIAKYRGRYLAGWDELRAARYGRLVEAGLIDPQAALSPRDTKVPAWVDVADREFQDLLMAVYAAQVDRMDQNVGRLLKKLDELGVAENTLVLFLSDNGADANPEGATKNIPPGPKESAHIYGRPWANLSNTPLRGYKHAMHEGGIATPLVAYWPREITRPGITHAPGHVMDLMATCLDVAGCDYPTTFADEAILPLEGRSLRPIFATGARPGHDALYWEHEGHRAVMAGRWKLVADHGWPWELYDLEADRTELDDLAASRPEVVADLATKYDAWAARTGVVPWNELRRTSARAPRPTP